MPVPTDQVTSIKIGPAQTAKPIPSLTASPPPAQLPTFPPTAKSTSIVKTQCLSVLPAAPQFNENEGAIVLNPNLGREDNSTSFLLNLSTGAKTPLGGDRILDPVVSPNQKFYAYHNYTKHQLMVFSADGRLQRSLPFEKEWGGFRWLDNENLIINLPEEIDPGNFNLTFNTVIPMTRLVVNPFTGHRQILKPDFPDIDHINNIDITTYDPQLTRVVYLAEIKGKGMGDILFDISNQKRLAELPNDAYSRAPVWAPDGSKVIITTGEWAIYIITRDGLFSRIPQNPEDIEGNGYRWSPDGKKVAFWLVSGTAESVKFSLAVLDVDSKEITDYCLSASEYSIDDNLIAPPYWSSNGKHLVVETNIQQDNITRDVYWVDLQEGLAAKIAENLTPSGWLAAP